MNLSFQKQGILLIGVVYLFLCCFSLYFYFERLNSDAGYYFFHTINEGRFHVEHGRLVLIPAEILALTAGLLHLPLKAAAIMYSLNHVLFPALLSALCIKKHQNFNAAILITVLQFAGLKFAVFTPQFELFYGLSLLVFTLSYIEFLSSVQQKWTRKNYAFFLLLLVFVFTSHPMAVYCYMAGLGIFFSSRKHFKTLLLSVAFFAVYCLWKYFFISDYEASKLANFNSGVNAPFGALWLNYHFFWHALTFLLKHYGDILLVVLAGCTYFILNKQFKQLLLYVLFIKVSILIIWFMFPPDTMGRYIEQVYFPFVFLACIWLFRAQLNLLIYAGLSALFCFRAFLITDNALEHVKRTEQMAVFTQIAQAQAGSKFYVTEADMGKALYEQGNWSYGFETMIYAAIHNEKTVSITKLEDLEYNNNMFRLKPDEYLFRPFDILPDSTLNLVYFKLKEGPYLLLMNKP